jgi:hypothetical protein
MRRVGALTTRPEQGRAHYRAPLSPWGRKEMLMSDAFTDDTVVHVCVAGHRWREHANGQVTPSWGLGGTYIDVEDPRVCPEPATDAQGLYDCPSCESKHRPGDGLMGMSFSPWEYTSGGRQECEIPRAACGKPPVRSRRWGDRNHPWVSDGRGGLYTLWWLARRGERDRLVAYTGGLSDCAQVIDLHTGEIIYVSIEDQAWDPARTRKATVADLPEHVRHTWPTRAGKTVAPGYSDGGPSNASGPSTVFFLRACNAEFMVLDALARESKLRVGDSDREFMWATQDCAENPWRTRRRREDNEWVPAPREARALSVVVAERVSSGRWPSGCIAVSDLKRLDELVERQRAQRAGAVDLPVVQLELAW